MTTPQPLPGAVLLGGQDGADPRPEHGSTRGSVAVQDAAHAPIDPRPGSPWPAWAREQLLQAIALAEQVPDGVSAARVLYDEWFNPAIDGAEVRRSRRPLAGLYRGAHAGSGSRRSADGVTVLDRHDVVGVNGWWRTWGASWTPPRTRPGSVRVLLSPCADRLADFVHTVTAALLDSTISWSLGCATDPRRVGRCGAAVLDLPGLDALPDGLLDELARLLRPVAPPLSLPLAPGVGAAGYPDNGMTFGEHRCHLIALALRQATSGGDALAAVAAVFAAHGIDPARPHESRSRVA